MEVKEVKEVMWPLATEFLKCQATKGRAKHDCLGGCILQGAKVTSLTSFARPLVAPYLENFRCGAA